MQVFPLQTSELCELHEDVTSRLKGLCTAHCTLVERWIFGSAWAELSFVLCSPKFRPGSVCSPGKHVREAAGGQADICTILRSWKFGWISSTPDCPNTDHFHLMSGACWGGWTLIPHHPTSQPRLLPGMLAFTKAGAEIHVKLRFSHWILVARN